MHPFLASLINRAIIDTIVGEEEEELITRTDNRQLLKFQEIVLTLSENKREQQVDVPNQQITFQQ